MFDQVLWIQPLNSFPIHPFLSVPAPSRTSESPSKSIHCNSVLTTLPMSGRAPSHPLSGYRQHELATIAFCSLYTLQWLYHSLPFRSSSSLIKINLDLALSHIPKIYISPSSSHPLHHHLMLPEQPVHHLSPVKPAQSPACLPVE